MFDIDTKQLHGLERRLERLNSRGLPYATRQTMNDLAFESRAVARAELPTRMVLRNKHAINSIQVTKATSLNISQQAAHVGSTADYMATQETGGIKTKQGGAAVAIPTTTAAGQGRNAKPRTRLPRAALKMGAIHLKRITASRNAKNRKQRNAIAMATSDKYVFLDLGRRKGIFRKDKGGGVTMLHDLTRASVQIPKNEWLKPATEAAERKLPGFYKRALEFQLRRF